MQDGKKRSDGDEGKYLADEENIHWIRSNMQSLTDLRGDCNIPETEQPSSFRTPALTVCHLCPPPGSIRALEKMEALETRERHRR